jgi:hypothetical protein
MDRDRCAVLEGEATVPGQVIGVRVRFDRPDDLDVVFGRRRQHRLERIGRVDDRGDAGLLVTDQVRRAPEVVVEELLEEHGM